MANIQINIVVTKKKSQRVWAGYNKM